MSFTEPTPHRDLSEPPGTRRLLADLCLERVNGPDTCRWALSALEAGFDTPSLRILAGMSCDSALPLAEVRPYLDTALSELNLDVSSRGEVLREYARAVAEELVAGTRAIEPSLDEIHRAVVSPLNHPADLLGW